MSLQTIAILCLIGALVFIYRSELTFIFKHVVLRWDSDKSVIVKGTHDALTPLPPVPPVELEGGKGSSYSYSFWLRVDDWDEHFSKIKPILTRSDPENPEIVNPAIYLAPRQNELVVAISTISESGVVQYNPTKDVRHNTCRVSIPLQKSMHVVVSLWSNSVIDIFVDAVLQQSCDLNDFAADFTKYPLFVAQRGTADSPQGFRGSLSKMVYYNKALTTSDITTLYREGSS